jgi:glycine/serine hydroxymethyltransferase
VDNFESRNGALTGCSFDFSGFVILGAPAMTSRGLKEKDFEQIVDFLERAVNIMLKVQKE